MKIAWLMFPWGGLNSPLAGGEAIGMTFEEARAAIVANEPFLVIVQNGSYEATWATQAFATVYFDGVTAESTSIKVGNPFADSSAVGNINWTADDVNWIDER